LSVKQVKSLASDSVIYGLAGIISRMITVFLVPIYTRIFKPSDYGIISLINATFFVVGMLSICALDNSAARWYYDTSDDTERKKTIASWFWFQLALGTALCSIMIFSGPIFFRYVFDVQQKRLWLIWLFPCFTLITNILPGIIWNWYRFSRKPKATIIYTLSQSLLTIGLTVLFVVVFKWGILGVYAALFISSFVFSCIGVAVLRDWINLKYFERKRLQEMLRFSLPLVPAAIAFWLINSTDAYFIQFFRNQSEVGLFSVGASLASGVALFTGAFQQAWGPFAFSIINEPDVKRTYANVFLVFGVVSSIILLAMFLFSPEILMLLTTPQYYHSAWVASILSINIILIGFSYIASIGTNIVKNNTHYSIGVFAAACVTVVLDIILIPMWGKEGSAIATVLAQLIVPVYLFYHANRLYPVNYPFGRVSLFMLSSVVFGILGRTIYFQQLRTGILVKCIMLFLFASLVFLIVSHKKKLDFFRLKLRTNSFN
jgi:O-antigen/teichoic acid export membrane protein